MRRYEEISSVRRDLWLRFDEQWAVGSKEYAARNFGCAQISSVGADCRPLKRDGIKMQEASGL